VRSRLADAAVALIKEVSMPGHIMTTAAVIIRDFLRRVPPPDAG
jgi:hypothetical protein